jgi:hypothetical protein
MIKDDEIKFPRMGFPKRDFPGITDEEWGIIQDHFSDTDVWVKFEEDIYEWGVRSLWDRFGKEEWYQKLDKPTPLY